MYLFMFTLDGRVKKSRTLTAVDIKSAENGFIEIVDISNPEKPLQYRDGSWNELDGYDSDNLGKKSLQTSLS